MQHTLQTDLNHELNARIEEWLADHPEATPETVRNGITDSLTDYAGRDRMVTRLRDELDQFGKQWEFHA